MKQRWKKRIYLFLVAVMTLQPVLFSYAMAATPYNQTIAGVQTEAKGQLHHGNHLQHGQSHAAPYQAHQHDSTSSFNCCQSPACSGAIAAFAFDLGAVVAVSNEYELHLPYNATIILPTEHRPPRTTLL